MIIPLRRLHAFQDENEISCPNPGPDTGITSTKKEEKRRSKRPFSYLQELKIWSAAEILLEDFLRVRCRLVKKR